MTQFSHDSFFIITSPPEAEDNPDFSPFRCSAPEMIAYCCFFKSSELRQEYLDTIRAHALLDEKERDPDMEKRLRREWLLSMRGGDHEIALLTLVQWWMNVREGAYHIYRLKIGYTPYVASCIIAFDDLTPDALRANMVVGIDGMETRKMEIMEEFGFGGLGI